MPDAHPPAHNDPSVPFPAGGDHPRRRASDQPAHQPDHQPGSPPGYQGPDRRKNDTGSPTGLERRRGPGRRLSDFTKAAEEGELTKEQFLFVMAIESFKRANAKTYPAWTDVLEVIRLLGYRKVQPSTLKLRNAEDFTEAPDTPANVRPKGFERREVA